MLRTFKDKAFLREFFHIAFPVMVQTFITFIVSFLDNIMVGSVSDIAVSAVYAANQVTFIFFVLAWGIIAGASILMQQFAGAKDERNLKAMFGFKMMAMTLFLAMLVPLSYWLGEKIIWLYCRADQNALLILEEGRQYLNLINISYIPLGYSVVIASSFREIGKTKFPMLAGIVALCFNGVFNAIFIYACKWGARGAAYATIIARMAELIILVALVMFSRPVFAIKNLKEVRMSKGLLKLAVQKSWPLFINEICWSGGMIMISLAYAQRDSVLSALSVVTTMGDIFGIVFQGLSVGIGVMVGKRLGRSEIADAKETTRKLYVLGVTISLAFGIIMACLSPFIPMLFTKISPAQKALARDLIIVYALMMWAFSMSTCGYNILKAGGKSFLTFLLDSGMMWLLIVPLAWILSKGTDIGLLYIYIAVQGADILKAALGVFIVRKGAWAQNIVKSVQNI